jgi:AraC-like DNA-binding protein
MENHTIPVVELERFDFTIKRMEDIEAERRPDERPHRHAFYTIVFLAEGSGTHTIDFVKYPMEAGNVFFVAPGQVHSVDVDTNGLRGYALMFNRGFLTSNGIRESFLEDLRLFGDCDDDSPVALTTAQMPRPIQIAEEMLDLEGCADPLQFEAIGALLKLFLIECLRAVRERPEFSHHERFANDSILRRFKRSVDEHFHRWHKVQDFAEALNVSPGYLNEVVRTNLGKSAKQYLQERILLESKRLALFSEVTAKEVAYKVGFEDQAHFSRFFKNQTGSSFSDWRSATLDFDNNSADLS